MWEKIKSTLILYRNIIILILFCMSLIINVALAIGKGIHFYIKSEAISNAYSNASSASLVIMGLNDVQNKKIKIKYKIFSFGLFSGFEKDYKEVVDFLNSITPLQYCFSKVNVNSFYSVVIYPEFEEK